MMRRWSIATLAIALLIGNAGCLSRLLREGAGAVRGARGKVVPIQAPSELGGYRGLRVESITVSSRLMAPDDLAKLVRDAFARAVEKNTTLTPGGTPRLLLSGEVIHFERGGAVDTVIGPLEEVIVRTKLIDESAGSVLAEANLVGRSKASTSSGTENLSEGAGRALIKWLKSGGVKIEEEEDGND
ncbi:MAG: hypothetical protein HUU22_11580 [Phycisphaerae bacterium]|nr:hypothetical protein [Phycisphaerae bacterium]NUQ46663.1 hypothetical protein [Phycisphaerae bacterium]